MKVLACPLLAVLLTSAPARAQTRPRPPGLQQADQAAAQADKNLPPPTTPPTRFDLGKIQHDADELARIAQTIPLDVSSLQKGLLPKEMTEKLKQIEKLSKHLRGEINP
jgi:hypothetical protein